jgi:hypothetical protein
MKKYNINYCEDCKIKHKEEFQNYQTVELTGPIYCFHEWYRMIHLKL